MAGHKVLNGVAAGIVNSFISRNNDVDGYWAMGKLCRFAMDQGYLPVAIDLLGRRMSQADGSLLSLIGTAYQPILLTQIARAGFAPQRVAQAGIIITFEERVAASAAAISLSVKPFVCVVTIVDDHRRVHQASATGRCRPHDPTFEMQSKRPDRSAS